MKDMTMVVKALVRAMDMSSGTIGIGRFVSLTHEGTDARGSKAGASTCFSAQRQ
jgi:hypothetical protein